MLDAGNFGLDREKSVKVVSGGEQRRLMFGKLALQEPTNHLDMESIEALHLALENYPGIYDEYLRSQGLVEKSRAA